MKKEIRNRLKSHLADYEEIERFLNAKIASGETGYAMWQILLSLVEREITNIKKEIESK